MFLLYPIETFYLNYILLLGVTVFLIYQAKKRKGILLSLLSAMILVLTFYTFCSVQGSIRYALFWYAGPKSYAVSYHEVEHRPGSLSGYYLPDQEIRDLEGYPLEGLIKCTDILFFHIARFYGGG